MSWLSSFLHPGRAYEQAQEQMDKYYPEAQKYLKPYYQHGQDVYGGLSGAMNQLLDPMSLQDKWSQGYKESDYAKNLEEMASQHGLNAASSMGLMGSTPALQALQTGTTHIAQADKQQYLQDLMQKYLQGAGIAQNIYGMGGNAASGLSNNAMQMGGNSAQMAYGKQAAGGNLFGKLLGTGLTLAAGALGGPAGAAAAGSQAGGAWNLF